MGVLAAQVTHAAGESAAAYQPPINSTIYYGNGFFGARAVVLEVKTEEDLFDTIDLLEEMVVEHVKVFETSPPYHGQLMALGCVPVEGRIDCLAKFQTLKTCLPTVTELA